MTDTEHEETPAPEPEPDFPGGPEGEPEPAPEPDDDEQPEPDETAPEATQEGRCEAETTVGGTLYRCALPAEHDGDHAFQPADDEAAAEAEAAKQAAAEQRRMAKAQERLAGEAERHAKRIREIIGEDAAILVPCELCWEQAPGFRWPTEPDEPTKAKLRAILGLPSLENYRPDNYSRECDDCGGLGITLTGSKVPKHTTIQCIPCKGLGWIPVGPERDRGGLPAPNGAQPVVTAEDQAGAPATDPWGRPKGDPDYGRMPGFTVAT